MSWSGGADAHWDMGPVFLRPLKYLLRFVGVVRDAIWHTGIEVVGDYWGVDDLVRYRNLCETVDGELD